MAVMLKRPLRGPLLTYLILMSACLAVTALGFVARGIPLLTIAATRAPVSPVALALLAASGAELGLTGATVVLFSQRRTRFRPFFVAACLCRAARSLAHIVLSFFAMQFDAAVWQFLDMTAAVLGLIIAVIMLVYWTRHFAGARRLDYYLMTGSRKSSPLGAAARIHPAPPKRRRDSAQEDRFRIVK